MNIYAVWGVGILKRCTTIVIDLSGVGVDLIGLAITFLILAVIAYVLGARGIAGMSMGTTK